MLTLICLEDADGLMVSSFSHCEVSLNAYLAMPSVCSRLPSTIKDMSDYLDMSR